MVEAVLAQETCCINCPYNSIGSSNQIEVTIQEPRQLKGCEVLHEFLSSGSCRSVGCIFLRPRTLQKCPFEKEGGVDTKAVMRLLELSP